MDQQGQIHTFQASQPGTQDPTAKSGEQTAAGLPGQAQAITALASGSRILIVDADGQAWTWDANNTGKAEPVRVRQNPGIRIVQAQALSKGILLLDADGQTYHIADSTTNPTALSLPSGAKASSISSSKDQTIITSTDGHVWAWKPGETPKRADDGNQQYMQTAEVGSMITSISKQGDIYEWSLDGQGRPGKPARLDTATAPILESASMDGQALTLSRNNDSWQADIPARKPGPTTILITGRQDSRPFTRNLKYTVDQPLTRADRQGTTYTVSFNADGGSPEPGDQHVSTPYGRVKRPSPDPTREGFLFDGWFIGQVAYDFSRPVTKDLTLTAKWTERRNTKWNISPDKGSQLGRESTTITPPDSASRGIKFSQVSAGNVYNSGYGFSLAVGSDGNAYAWGRNQYGQLGDGTTTSRTTPLRVRKPDRNTDPDVPKDFTYVQGSAGYDFSLALGSDGNIYAWGSNSNGQLGDGTTTQKTIPVKVKPPVGKPTSFTYVQVSAGGDHSLALGSDGNIYAWGSNSNGQLGDGTTTQKTIPVKVKPPVGKPTSFTYVQVSAGGDFSLALGSDGNAYAWGANGNGQLGNDTTKEAKVPVPVSFNLQLVITGFWFDGKAVSGLTRGDGGSVTVLTPAHAPGTVTVSVDYTIGGAPQTPDTSLRYTYLPAGVLPKAGGEGILLALATGITGITGVLASRRHRREQHQLLHASHE